MKQKLVKWLKWPLFLCIGIGLMYFVLRKQNLVELWQEMQKANILIIVLAMTILLFAHYIRGMRWQLVIEQMGFSASKNMLFHSVMIGYLVNLAFPRAGEVARCSVVARKSDAPLQQLIGSVIAERLVDLLFLFIILLACIALFGSIVIPFFWQTIFNPVLQLISNHILIFIIAAVIGLGIVLFLFTRKKDNTKKENTLIQGLKEGVFSILKVEKRGLFILYSVLIWLGYFTGTWLMFFAIPATAHLAFGVALVVLAAGSLGMAAPVQGGIGAYHWLVSQSLLPFAVNENGGILYATLNHSAQTLLVIIFGTISFIAISLLRSKNELITSEV